MLREYRGFVTPAHDVSLVYLRIEEYLLTHLVLPLAAWTVKETAVIFYKSIIGGKQNETKKTQTQSENINYSGIQLNLIYTGLGVAASEERTGRGAAVHT